VQDTPKRMNLMMTIPSNYQSSLASAFTPIVVGKGGRVGCSPPSPKIQIFHVVN